MPIRIRDNGVLRTITKLPVMVGGTLRPLQSVKAMDGGALRTVATFGSPVTLSIVPDPASGTADSTGPILVRSERAVATPSGGTGPYTYSWVRLDGGAVAETPSTAGTFFSETVGPGQTRLSQFQCTATDSLGQTASDTVTVDLTNVGAGDLN